MATLNGANIFGGEVHMVTSDNPSAEQVNHYFGLNGSERLHGGLTGRVTLVRGLLTASSAAGLLAARELIRSYNDGVARTLVDTLGQSWTYVVLRTYEPGEPMAGHGGGYHMEYRATLQHLN